MLSALRPTLRPAVALRRLAVAPRTLSSKALTPAEKDEQERLTSEEALEAEKSPVQRYMERLHEVDPHMVAGTTVPYPDPVLPDKPSEVAALDPAHTFQDISMPDGGQRTVRIMQRQMHPGQSPNKIEMSWIISFQDEGELAQCWDNPLMGWVSGADPMQNMKLQMDFKTAADAAYFAKKRGWKYSVDEPIVRKGRDDDAQYQDNFLPQSIAGIVKRERTNNDHWSRKAAGTSHYFRPLKFHGDGTVAQHGPNGDAEISPHVEGHYKQR